MLLVECSRHNVVHVWTLRIRVLVGLRQPHLRHVVDVNVLSTCMPAGRGNGCGESATVGGGGERDTTYATGWLADLKPVFMHDAWVPTGHNTTQC